MRVLLTQEARWARVIVFGLLFMLLPVVIQQSWEPYWQHYYQTAPIEDFYVAFSLEAENVCYGEITQNLVAYRKVYHTDTGWAAEVVRELQRVDSEGKHVKVYDETASVFIENSEDGRAEREAVLPVVPVGNYHWDVVIVRLYLPFGVVREAIPTLTSNTFAVEDCKT